MKLYVRIKINDKWTYRAINTKNTDMLSLIGNEDNDGSIPVECLERHNRRLKDHDEL